MLYRIRLRHFYCLVWVVVSKTLVQTLAIIHQGRLSKIPHSTWRQNSSDLLFRQRDDDDCDCN